MFLYESRWEYVCWHLMWYLLLIFDGIDSEVRSIAVAIGWLYIWGDKEMMGVGVRGQGTILFNWILDVDVYWTIRLFTLLKLTLPQAASSSIIPPIINHISSTLIPPINHPTPIHSTPLYFLKDSTLSKVIMPWSVDLRIQSDGWEIKRMLLVVCLLHAVLVMSEYLIDLVYFTFI